MFIYKNKGILIPVYLFLSLMAVTVAVSFLKRQVGEELDFERHFIVIMGTGLIIAGLWTYLTRDSYYIANGKRKRMYEDNSLYFISMEVWAYIFFVVGIALVIGGVLKILEVI